MLFSLGNFFAPLLVEAFSKLGQINGFQPNSTDAQFSGFISHAANISLYNVTQRNQSYSGFKNTTETLNCVKEVSVKYNHFYWCAYIVVGIVTLITAVPFFINACRRIKVTMNNEKPANSLHFVFKILTLLVIFSFFNSGIEEILGGFLKVFVVKQFCWSDSKGNLLVSLYWGTFTVAKLIGVIESLYLHPSVIVIVHLSMLIVSFCSLLVANLWQVWLWISCVIIGIALAPIWPARLAWADRYIKLSGILIGLIFVTEGIGSMIWPSLIGFLVDNFGMMCFVYSLCILGTIALVIFIVMHCIAKPYGERFEN